MPTFAYSLILSPWASVAFQFCGELMTSLGEGAFDFCKMSHILFEVGATSLKERVLGTVTPVGYGAYDDLLTMLQANVT